MRNDLPDFEEILRATAKASLLEYVCYTDPSWKPAPHLEVLCKALEDIEKGNLCRLIVCLPPRHGKSQVVSKAFPSWFLGRNPDKELILTSYGAELATDFSRQSRALIEEYGKSIFGIEVAPDASAASRWGLKGRKGGMTATGVGGPITGRGAHVAIIDDPFKNWEDASSKTCRNKTMEWFASTLRTRLSPNGAIIVVQTRWHEDDLTGRLIKDMKAGGEQWSIIDYPAIAEAEDQLGRAPGQALWPERFPESVLAEIRTALGHTMWNALYQQHPSPADGVLFKKNTFRYYTTTNDKLMLLKPEGSVNVALSDCQVFQTVDTAATLNERSDFFVVATWAITPEHDLMLLDLYREKAETTSHLGIMEIQYQKWKPKFQAIESKSFGLNLIQQLTRQGFPIRSLKADKDKYSRALPVAALYEAGKVYHPVYTPWLGTFEDELLAFPNGEHDDCVDVTAYAATTSQKCIRQPVRYSAVDLCAHGF